ncbi:putative Cro/Cl-type repressor (endogenous virus) [Clostridium phage phiCT453A]|uniref:helix-turn-helix domain-containing protein n=1 Tax=Clostridium phage phiCT453A TaxID=1567012 RepID=UPI000572AAAE|nr:helix-turn-helix transcriptional regulator [Clostridium tetani]YP_009216649.1 helix-turn-helix domain-containing protein [Clostridium phage phiCT453A]AJA42495.1 putative Cro/Cl-type repressor [Clostridium phage phiCT453A]RXM58079.1 XRE family transcriptional regulator [Clostridium tetani]
MGLEIINKIRKEKGFTSKELSQKSKVPIGTLNKILNGQTKNPAYETILALANALNCPVDMFCKNDEFKLKNNLYNNLSKKETTLLTNFNKLNETGKDEAIKRVEELTQIDKYTHEEKNHLMPIAAHDKEGNFSKEDMEHDLNLMKDDELWK